MSECKTKGCHRERYIFRSHDGETMWEDYCDWCLEDMEARYRARKEWELYHGEDMT